MATAITDIAITYANYSYGYLFPITNMSDATKIAASVIAVVIHKLQLSLQLGGGRA